MSDTAPDTEPTPETPTADPQAARIAELEAELSAARDPRAARIAELEAELSAARAAPAESLDPVPSPGPESESTPADAPPTPDPAPGAPSRVGDVVELTTVNPADGTDVVQHGMVTGLIHDGERLVHVLVSWFAPGRAQLPPDAEGLTKK